MLHEFTFEVAGESQAEAECAELGLTLVRVSPLPSLHAHRHEVRGRFYALATKECTLEEAQAITGYVGEHVPLVLETLPNG